MPRFAFKVSMVAASAFVAGAPNGDQVATLTDQPLGAPERDGRPVVLDFEHLAWPWAVGVMQHGADNGLRACAPNPTWAFAVTDRFVCTPGELAAGWHLHMTTGDVPGKPGPVVARAGTTVVVAPPA